MKRKLLIWTAIIAVLLIGLEIGGRARMRRQAGEVFAIVPETSTGKRLSPRPGNIRVYADPYVVYRIRPNQQFKDCHINNHGFRGPDFETEKEDGVIRIVVTGGSAAFGSDVFDDDNIFTVIMNKRLDREGGTRFEVINGSAIAYNSANEFALFVHDLMRYEPDLVVNFSGWNDYYIPQVSPGNRPDSSEFFMGIEGLLTRGTIRALLSRSTAYYLIMRETRRVINQVTGGQGVGFEPDWKYHAASVDYWADNMRNFAAFCDGLGIGHIIALQPEESSRSKNCDSEKADLENRGENYVEAVRKTYREFKVRAKGLSERFPNTEFVDLTPAFDGTDECIFFDWVHFNGKGHEIIARELTREVNNYIQAHPELFPQPGQ